METEISYKDLYNKGDHLILKMYSDDIFEGDVSDVGKNRIDFMRVKQHNNDNKLSGIYTFYRTEIDTIQKLKSKEIEKPSTPEPKNIADDLNRLKLSDSEYDRLKEMEREYVYIIKADTVYFQAIELLANAETLGVTGLGLEKNRSASLKILAVSTWNKVYLFDFVTQKQSQFYPELKEILQAEAVCKVIHEAGPLIDILYRKYNVYVKNVFDTQIVDMIIKKKQSGHIPVNLSDVSDLLTNYLNFPSSYLKNALETTNSKWTQRPLSERRRKYAAQLNIFLITLKECMQRILLAEVYETIDKIHEHYYYSDCYTFTRMWQERNLPSAFKDLIPNFTEQINEESK